MSIEVGKIYSTCDTEFETLPWKTGVTSYIAEDDGDNQFGNGDATDPFFNTEYTHVWGHKRRFVGTTGGYHNGTDYVDVNGTITTKALAFPNDIMLDMKQHDKIRKRILAYSFLIGSTVTFALAISNQPYTFGGYSDWLLPTSNNLSSLLWMEGISLGGNSEVINYPPIEYSIPNTGSRITSSTYLNAITARVVIGQVGHLINLSTGTNARVGLQVRFYTYAELGL
jgi:hypothetical protein